MKKIFLGFTVFLSALISAQQYPDYYPANNNYSNYYGDNEDAYYFPDDYYYEYPNDYYTNNFYESTYNDYRRSINDVNWNRFFSVNRLAPWQIQQIIMLNELYPSFNSWDFNYRYNPDRWYYDRFYALERILGPNVFVVFQNSYYNGYSPVNYYRNYRRQHYSTVVYVVPRYRNVNVNRYRVDRNQYHQSNPRNNYGFRDTPNQVNGNWNKAPQINGFRNNDASNNIEKGSGFRNNGTAPNANTKSNGNSGFRNDAATKTELPAPKTNGFRNQNSLSKPQPSAPQNRGFRNESSGNRQAAPERRIENNSGTREMSKPTPAAPSKSSRSSGFRFTSK